MLLHLALTQDWLAAQQTGSYPMSTLGRTIEQEGFLHCCRDEHQLAGVAARFYADVDEPLTVLEIGDVEPYGLRVVDEPPFPGAEETFPHVHGGPLPAAAVVGTRAFDRSADLSAR